MRLGASATCRSQLFSLITMGEEVKKVEEVKVNDQTKEEAPAAALEAEKKEAAAAAAGEENKEEAASKEPLPPPPPVILGIDLHCTGCSNKITRCILRCKGVEGVEVDMAKNMVTVKGVVNPYDICDRLRKKTMRNAMVISPPPPPPPIEEDVAAAPKEEPVIIHSQVNEVTTVELLVNMHCEACAQQLHKKILKMRGVQSAKANHDTSKLSVTGTMSTDSLIQYIDRRTGKLATVAPLPLPLEPTKEEGLKEDGIKKPMESLEIREKPPIEDSEDKKDTNKGNKEEGTAKSDISAGIDDKKANIEVVDGFADEEMIKRMMYWPNPYRLYYNLQADGEAITARMMPIVHPYPKPMMPWMTPVPPPPPSPMPLAPPMYHYYNNDMVERQLPTPQYFSDENPDACVIS